MGSELVCGPEECGGFPLPTFHNGRIAIGQRRRGEVAANLELHCKQEKMIIVESLVFGPCFELYALWSGSDLPSVRSVWLCEGSHDHVGVKPAVFLLYITMHKSIYTVSYYTQKHPPPDRVGLPVIVSCDS